MDLILFPFVDYWWLYLAFTALVLMLLALDLGVFHADEHEVTIKEAAIWSVVWIGLALLFNFLLYLYAGWKFPLDPRLNGLDHEALASQTALQFLTGFVVEKSLAIDNIFVFVVVFSFFAVPAKYQHKILFYGILGALVFRALFIALGSVLMQYEWVVIVFGLFLLFTGIKIFFAPDKEVDPSKNPILKLVTRFLPVTSEPAGSKFFVRRDGKLYATSLFLCLVFVEVSDVIFAVDSVPAIFALTREPLIVFTSNIFAILGLRSLYFLLAGVYRRFYLLKYGLGLVLIFVGLKMVWLNEAFGGKFPVGWSLGIITFIIVSSVGLSLLRPQSEMSATA